MSEIATLLEVNGVDLSKLTEVVITRAAKENRPQFDVLKEEILKIAKDSTDQSKSPRHNKKFNDIITPIINRNKKEGN